MTDKGFSDSFSAPTAWACTDACSHFCSNATFCPSRFIEDAVSKFRTKLGKWKAPVFLKDPGIKPNEIKAIAPNADLQGRPGHLKKLALKDIEAILTIAAG